VLESNSQSVVNLLKNEIESWKPFIEALRESERYQRLLIDMVDIFQKSHLNPY